MKRRKLIAHLHANGCVLLRQGGNHSIYINPANNTTVPVPPCCRESP